MEHISRGEKLLESRGLDPGEAAAVFAEASGITPALIHLEGKSYPARKTLSSYYRLIRARRARMPLQYASGRAFFFGLEFRVTEDTLIPRPETEILAEKALEHLNLTGGGRVLELGSGCGNIAIALAVNSDAELIAVEKSPSALETARVNAASHGVSGRVRFLEGDMLELSNVLSGEVQGSFDLLISNPPYVSEAEYGELEEEVRKEPPGALLAGSDGLRYIKPVLEAAPSLVKPGGAVFLETSCFHREPVMEHVSRIEGISSPAYLKDYSGKDRVFTCRIAETYS